ncbi:MAG: tetratricopeptide repeat protein [Elusimicrobia bacterium]|nr:tetratricopeptide repeat protein [Elusimicrobiota bacterium]
MLVKNTTIDPESGVFFALLVLVALLFAWTAVAPCLDNGFTNWDETRYIIQNHKIKSLSLQGVRSIFASRDLEMYSPLSTLSYALNYHFSGLAPKAYHATSIALHLANTALVMFLVRLLLSGPWPAFFCGLFFGLHPAHVESVAWAAERKDLLYSFFYLLSLCAYTLSLRGKKTYFAALGLFLCSLLSKPMAVTLPLALLLIDYLKLEKAGKREWLNKLPFLAGAAIFALANLPSAAELSGRAPQAVWRLALAFYNAGFYVYRLAWPFDLSAMYLLPPGGAKSVYVLAALTAAAAALLWKFFRRDKEIMFGAGLYLALLLPVLQFIPFGPVISADRYTYLSSLGLFIVLASAGGGAWARAGALRNTLGLLIVAAALTFTVAARLRCAVWKDSLTLWTDTLRKEPSAGIALVNLCSEYLDLGMEARAAACLKEAMRQYPGKEESFYNLGLLLYRRGDFAGARPLLERTLELNGKHAKALFIMGNIARFREDIAGAEQLYLRSAASDSGYDQPLRLLGELAAARGDKEAALEYYQRALAADPANPATIELIAALRRKP